MLVLAKKIRKKAAIVIKTKACFGCKVKSAIAFRIRIRPDKNWIFVCKVCCETLALQPGYQYGGTWKGKNH